VCTPVSGDRENNMAERFAFRAENVCAYNIIISFVAFEGFLPIHDANGFDPRTIFVKIVVINRIVNMRGNRYCARSGIVLMVSNTCVHFWFIVKYSSGKEIYSCDLLCAVFAWMRSQCKIIISVIKSRIVQI
jgi:hypothetical protein